MHPVRSPDDELATAIGEATPSTLPRVLQLAARSAKHAGVRAVASGRWLAEVTIDVAQRLPVRDIDTLIAHHHGASGATLATELVRTASRASAAVGAATGVAAAVSEASPAGWSTLPFELLGETLVVVGIEMKLVAELHVVAGRAIEGTPAQRGASVARAWAEGRGIRYDELMSGGAGDLLGRQARRRLSAVLRRRLIRRGGRNLASFAPLLAGAAAGAELNRRANARGGIAGRAFPRLDLERMPVEPPGSTWSFPPPHTADRQGIVGVGADLEPGTLLAAYRSGIFPMPLHEGGSLGWWSPDPRGVIPLDGFKVSRSLRRSAGRYEIKVDTAFVDVIDACAEPSRKGGWIDAPIRAAYTALHELGWVHSVEAWDEHGNLAGGLYGVAIGGLFAGESMFHRSTDASKAALVELVSMLREDGGAGRLLDVQWTTDHLRSLGAVDVPRSSYLTRLRSSVELPLPPAFAGGSV